MMNWISRVLVGISVWSVAAASMAQDLEGADTNSGPLRDATYQVVWLIESDDENRPAYEGQARDGLTEIGFGRLVVAGSVLAGTTIGTPSTVAGESRYGAMQINMQMLNTTRKGEVQVKLKIETKSPAPLQLSTTARVPMGTWAILGASNSRVGVPKAAIDGKRGVVIVRVHEGIVTLD